MARGVRLSIDDFGTGYSSLGYLQKMPIDGVKIDRSFVQALGAAGSGNDTGLTLIRSIVAMAHGMKLRVVVEGVETVAQLETLATAGCDEVQGFLLGHPEPRDNALARLNRGKESFASLETLSRAVWVAPVTMSTAVH